MGLTGNDPDRIILEIQCAWTDARDDAIVQNISRDMTTWLESKLSTWLGPEQAYLPLFMNDAMSDQNVTGSYRDYEKLKALQLQEDRQGVLRTRTGGFKY